MSNKFRFSVDLPLTIDDIVYFGDRVKVYEAKVRNIEINIDTNGVHIFYTAHTLVSGTDCLANFEPSDIGKQYFVKKEDAEKRVEELKRRFEEKNSKNV